MPHYALEIREPDGSITEDELTTPVDEWFDTGHEFKHKGRDLEVATLEEKDGFDQLLICRVES